MRGNWGITRRQGPSAFDAVCAFLDGRMEEHQTLDWAIRLEPQETLKRAAVIAVLDGAKGRSMAEPWKAAWHLLEESWATQFNLDPQRSNFHSARFRLNDGERSGDLIQTILKAVAPRFTIAAALGPQVDSGKRGTRKPRKVEDLVRAYLTSFHPDNPGILELDQIDNASFLESLAQGLDATVNLGMDMIRRLGCYSMPLRRVYHVSGMARTPGGDDPDAFHDGLTPSVKLLHAVVVRLGEVNSPAASAIVARWRSSGAEIHVRLWAALARDPRMASNAEVARFLVEAEASWFWDSDRFPEMAELRSLRFGQLDPESQTAILALLKRAPPRRLWLLKGNLEESERLRSYLQLREWRRLEVAGNTLVPAIKAKLDKDIGKHPDLVAMRRVDDGFPAGVVVTGFSAKVDPRFDLLAGEPRLTALEVALTTPSTMWREEGPAGGANAWLIQTGNLSLLLGDLEHHDGNLSAFPTLLTRFWRLHHPTQEDSADARVEGDRVLSLLRRAPDALVRMSIADLTQWLAFWKTPIASCPSLPEVWIRLWPLAVEATNSEPPQGESTGLRSHPAGKVSDRDDEVDLQIHGTPVGRMVEVFMRLCPSLKEIPHPFESPGPLANLRTSLWKAGGRAGLIVRCSFLIDLYYFLQADPTWAEAQLLPLLFRGGSEDARYWQAFMRTTQFSDVIQILGEVMADRAVDPNLGRSSRRSILGSLALESLHAFREGRSPAIAKERVQQALRLTDEGGRAYVADVVYRFAREVPALDGPESGPAANIRTAVLPFLAECWPQERSLVTPRISQSFATLPALAGEGFAATVQALSRFLRPFECWSLLDFGLFGEFEGVPRLTTIDTPTKAEALLCLLDLCIGNREDTVIPMDLASGLERIRELAPQLTQAVSFRRLATMARL